MADIAATRDLCIQLERTKESLARQISSQSASYEQVQVRLDDLTAERDLVRQQVSRSYLTGLSGPYQVKLYDTRKEMEQCG